MPRKKCEPGCECGLHTPPPRTRLHNELIGRGVKRATIAKALNTIQDKP